MVRILLGTGVTNKQGITQLNTDTSGNALTHSYTGTGAGELKLTARVYGVGFKDNGVTGDNNTDWYNSSDRLTVTTDTTGTLLTATDNNGYYICNLPDTSTNSIADTQEFTVPLVIEGDCVSISKTGTGTDAVTGLWLNDGVGETLYKMVTFDGAVTNGDHFKIVLDGSTGKLYVNGNTPTTTSLSLSGLMNLGLSVKAGSTLKYKNFKVYDMEHGLISQEYKVYDCKWLDKGDGTGNSNWNSSSAITPVSNGEYTTIASNNPSVFSARTFNTNCTVFEFDISVNVLVGLISLRQDTTSVTSLSKEYLGMTQTDTWYHIRIEVDGVQYRAIVDGNAKEWKTMTGSQTYNRFQFSIGQGTGVEIKYKNFMAW